MEFYISLIGLAIGIWLGVICIKINENTFKNIARSTQTIKIQNEWFEIKPITNKNPNKDRRQI